MSRPRKKIHEIVPVRKGSKAVVNFAGRSGIYLGPWDNEKDEPSPEATQRLGELVALWRADPSASSQSRPGDVLLAKLWADWRSSPEWSLGRAKDARRAEGYLFGSAEDPGPYRHCRVLDFGAAELLAVQRRLCDDGLSRSTVSRTVAAIRDCFAWGRISGAVPFERHRAMELIPPPVAGRVKESAKRRGVAWETVEATIPHLTPPLAAAVRLLWHTGARPSEILGLRVSDVLRGGRLRAVSGVILDLDSLGVWAVSKTEHKTDGADYDRVLFFGPKSQEVLSGLMRDRDGYLMRPTDGRADWAVRMSARRKEGGYGSYKRLKGESAIRKPGEKYEYGALTTAVRRASAAAGVQVWTPYQLRHQVGVLVQQQWGRNAARVFLGHRVGGVTEDYAGADLTAAAKVAQAWG